MARRGARIRACRDQVDFARAEEQRMHDEVAVVLKQRQRLMAGKRPKPLPPQLRATMDLLEDARDGETEVLL